MDDEQSKDGLENAITAYYGAAADGDYQYTYDNLVSEDSAQLSVDEWFTANEALASDQGSYDLIQISEPFPDGHYEAINNVSGDDRLTKWFYQDGGLEACAHGRRDRYVHLSPGVLSLRFGFRFGVGLSSPG